MYIYQIGWYRGASSSLSGIKGLFLLKKSRPATRINSMEEKLMEMNESVLKPHPLEALMLIILLLCGIGYCIIKLELVPHIPIMMAIFALIGYGLLRKVAIKDMETGMVDGAKSGLGAILIFFFIGMLVSSWMASGTIPTFIYGALNVVSGKFFYAIVFIITAIIGMSIGSSLTTAATIGVAFMSVSQALGLSDAITAGAIISGAFFGDKMSPLSDTTNLASMVVKVDLFDHIRNMAWTTVPAFIFSLIIFAIMSPKEASANFATIVKLKKHLVEMGYVHWYSLIPFILLALLAIRKVSAIITLSAGVFSALVISFFVNGGMKLSVALNLLYFGYKSESGIKEIDALLSNGGMEKMMFSISLVLLALSMGGLLFKLGILPSLLSGLKNVLTNVGVLISTTALTAIGINFLVGEQYLSILLTGNAYRENYEKAGLQMKNLSRVLEDAGTVINPLVPWGVCGVFLTTVLGVSTLDYAPYALFCLLSPVMTIVFGWTGWTISRVNSGKAK